MREQETSWQLPADVRLDISVAPGPENTVVRLAGDIDATTAPVARERLAEASERYGPWLVADLTEVTVRDPAALDVIAKARRDAELAGGHLRVVACEETLRRILSLTRACC